MTTTQTMRRTILLLAAVVLALVISSGVALAVTKSCQASVACFGTIEADTLNGSDANDFFFARGRGDTLNGFDGNDDMYGEGGADKLFGGPGNDDLIGGLGLDTLSGGEDLDFYYFGPSWGKDTITDSSASSDGTPSSQNMLIFVKGPSKEDAQVPVTDDLNIRLSSADGPEVKNASGTTTINWDAHVIQRVESGAGDDQITGSLVANVISANHGGADSISSGGGNDRIDVADGSGDDVVDCGETLGNSLDNDTVFFDSGDQIAADCESQNPF